jgi:hypothetical protein
MLTVKQKELLTSITNNTATILDLRNQEFQLYGDFVNKLLPCLSKTPP